MNSSHTAGGEPPVELSDVAIQGRDLFFQRRLQDKTWQSVKTYTLSVTSALSTRPVAIRVSIPKAPHGFFWDLSTLTWFPNVRIVDKEGKAPPDDSKIAPINSLATSLLQNLELSLEGVSVSKFEYNSYAIVSFLNILLNYSYIERYAGNLALTGYTKDTPGVEETINPDINKGFEQRRKLFGAIVEKPVPGTPATKKKVFEYYTETTSFAAKLLTNFTSCPTPLPYGIAGDLLLSIHSPQYYMQMSEDDFNKGFHLDLSNVEFTMALREMSTGALRDFENNYKNKNVILNGRRLAVVKDVIRGGNAAYYKYNLTSGTKCPQRIAVVFVEEVWETRASKTGLKFACKFTGVEKTEAILNKLDIIHQGAPLERTTASTSGAFLRNMYMLYQRTSGYADGRTSGCIPLDQFLTNSFIGFFDCTKSKRASDSADILQEEIDPPLDLAVSFNDALKENVIVYVFLEYFTDAEITKNGDVTSWAFGKV